MSKSTPSCGRPGCDRPEGHTLHNGIYAGPANFKHPSDRITLANCEMVLKTRSPSGIDTTLVCLELDRHAIKAVESMINCHDDWSASKVGETHGTLLLLTQFIKQNCPPCEDTNFAVETLAVVNPPWPGQTNGQFQFNLRSIRIALFFARQAIALDQNKKVVRNGI